MLSGNEINTDENKKKTEQPRQIDRFGEHEETNECGKKEIACFRHNGRLNAGWRETQCFRVATPHEDIGEDEECDVDNGQQWDERRLAER